jgi:uncharacterized protein YecE (DUF72 family)
MTYARWRDSTPQDFRFAVKLPRTITHEGKLQNAREHLSAFLDQTNGLGEKRGPILVQLPPSLAFDRVVVSDFLDMVRTLFDGPLVCEPRHPTWFVPAVAVLLHRYRVARVAADPPPVPDAIVPAGWPLLVYFRLHGSPRKYWSRYDEDVLERFAVAPGGLPDAKEIWWVFDNTASGAALENAWELHQRLGVDRQREG